MRINNLKSKLTSFDEILFDENSSNDNNNENRNIQN